MTQELNVVDAIATPASSEQHGGAPATLRQIGTDERFSATTSVSGPRMVTAVYAIRKHENAPRYEKSTVFDFSNVSEEELLLLAMYGVKVTVQGALRSLAEREFLNPATYAKVDVKRDIVDAVSPKRNTKESALRLLVSQGVMTEAQAAEFLANAPAAPEQQ